MQLITPNLSYQFGNKSVDGQTDGKADRQAYTVICIGCSLMVAYVVVISRALITTT